MIARLVSQLVSRKQVLVPMAWVCIFVSVCDAAGVVCYGGAFTNDMEYQFFYTE